MLAGTAACFLSMGALVPVLPQYVAGELDLGFGVVGLVVAVPSVTGILARPLAGRVVDAYGHRPAGAVGAGLLALAALALLGAGTLPALLACRAVAGVGEALVYVGFAAASVPAGGPARITWFSVAVYAGLLAGAPVGVVVLTGFGYPAAWVLAAAAALAGAGCALTLPRATPAARSTVDRPPLVHPAGLRPGVAYGASVWGYTAFNTFIPLHVAALGGHDARTVYVGYGVVLLGVRVAGHRLIERLPARRVGGLSLACTAVGLLVLMWPPTLLGGTALLAVGQALGLPAFLTAAIGAVPASQRGAALATVTAFFDVGFLTSALGLGAVTQLLGLGAGFTVAAAVSAAALPLFVRKPANHPVRSDP